MSNWSHEQLAEALSSNPSLKIAPVSRRSGNLPLGAPKSSQPARSPENDSGRPEPQIPLKAPRHNPKQDYKSQLVQQCALIGLKLEPEFKFSPTRKFRADWRVWHEGKATRTLIEYQGGIFSAGKQGHSSVRGILRDYNKFNEAQILGFIVICVTPKDITSGDALNWIEAALRP